MTDNLNIIILGNGISGITTARHLRRLSDCDITVISDESPYFFSRTALMYVYMGHMRLRDTQPYEPWFWEKNRIQLMQARVNRIDFSARTLFTDSGESLKYDRLVLALGSLPIRHNWPGAELDGVQGLYHLDDLQQLESRSAGLKRAVIVGGGLIGVEMAEMLHSRGIELSFLVRETNFWGNVLPAEESAMVSRHLKEHGIDLRLETTLKEILPDETGKKCAAVLTGQGERIDCGLVGVTVGVRPHITLLKGSPVAVERGILVDEYLKSSVDGVYAVGDCAELRSPESGRRAVEAVWYTGRKMGEIAARNLAAELHPHTGIQPRPYHQGIWFNSAKFFDIEYQVYGDIRTQLPDTHATLYWEHPKGKKSIRINYIPSEGRRVVGFNLMGIRYRQEVCVKWIAESADLETVLSGLGMANFDPELSPEYEFELSALYRQQTGRDLALKQRRGLPAVLKFLGR